MMNTLPKYESPTDEKSRAKWQGNVRKQQRSCPTTRQRLLGRFISAVLLTTAVLLLFKKIFVTDGHYFAAKNLVDDHVTSEIRGTPVELEAHIMSKCPDARDCLRQLVVPVMEQVSDKVEFRLSYIGKINNMTDDVECMHGPSECLGNTIELCAQLMYPDPKLYLGFATCMTSSYPRIPDRDLVENCAMEHGVDFQRLNKCLSDEGHGAELLRSSVKRSMENNVTKSCTVRLANKIRCIRDGGKWYDCPGGSEVDDLVRDINKLYEDTS